MLKCIKWDLKAREFVRGLDAGTRREIGTVLMLLQSGKRLMAPQSKPVKAIHENAHELRVRDRYGIYRIIYVLSVGEKILIPHAFTKKTQKIPMKEIRISIKRLKELINENK